MTRLNWNRNLVRGASDRASDGTAGGQAADRPATGGTADSGLGLDLAAARGSNGEPHQRTGKLVALLAAIAVVAGVAAVASQNGGRHAAAQSPGAGGSGPAVIVSKAHSGSAAPDFSKRLVFLVIGSDAGAPRFGRGGSVERGLADSIHLVVVDGKRKRGMVIGIPRDSYVPIPGHGSRKINAAMTMGGPPLLVRTVEQLAKLNIDYYALTSFDGLIDLVEGVGGVTVDVDRRVVDKPAGANLRAGRQRLSGSAALAYSRARKSLPDGDFGRSEHQGDVLIGGLRTFHEQSAKNPAVVIRWLGLATREVKMDLPVGEMMRLALFARQVKPSNLRNVVLSGGPSTAGGASIVRLNAGAQRTLANAHAGRF
jgi:polyisoprenyl-teichoic acid--peptidoglycan teichoic acid transferase